MPFSQPKYIGTALVLRTIALVPTVVQPVIVPPVRGSAAFATVLIALVAMARAFVAVLRLPTDVFSVLVAPARAFVADSIATTLLLKLVP